MNFKDYLIALIGEEKAKEVLNMNEEVKSYVPIVIMGKQGATGKSTLKRELIKRGYRAFEPHEINEAYVSK